MQTEEMTDSEEQESKVDSPDESSGVSDDGGSSVEESTIGEQNESAESASENTETAASDEPEQNEVQTSHAAVPEKPAITEHDYKALQAEFTRRSQKMKQLEEETQQLRQQMESFKDVDPDAIKKFRDQQQTPVWDPQSDKHQKFMLAQERARVISQMDVPQEQKRDLIASNLSDEELGWMQEWKTHQQREQQRFLQNPQNYINSLVEDRVKQTVEQRLNGYHTTQQVQSQTTQMMESPEFKSTYLTPDGKSINEWGERLNQMLQNGVNFDVADQALKAQKRMAEMEAENAELRKRAAAAGERDRLLRDGATDMTELRPGSGDIEEEAARIMKKQGIRVGSDKHIELLRSLEHKLNTEGTKA